MDSPAKAAVIEKIHRNGPIRFDEYMDIALYGDGVGFYVTGGAAGRTRDFVTSPESGPLFGAIVAKAIDQVWEDLGHPDPFVVVEAAAGRGVLAKAILTAKPACLSALRYVLVEPSEHQRNEQTRILPIEDPTRSMGPTTLDDEGDPQPAKGVGPIFTSISDMPAEHFSGVVIANELLDNLPARLFEYDGAQWTELLVNAALDRIGFVPERADDEATQRLESLVANPIKGTRVPLCDAAYQWVANALDLIDRGSLLIFDYGNSTNELAQRIPETIVRTYVEQQRGFDPFASPGAHDITCEVAFDQLPGNPPITRQAEWLQQYGIADEVLMANVYLQDNPGLADMTAIRMQSLIAEAKTLCDSEGLGAFQVAEWHR